MQGSEGGQRERAWIRVRLQPAQSRAFAAGPLLGIRASGPCGRPALSHGPVRF